VGGWCRRLAVDLGVDRVPGPCFQFGAGLNRSIDWSEEEGFSLMLGAKCDSLGAEHWVGGILELHTLELVRPIPAEAG